MKKLFSVLCTFIISSIAISQSLSNTVTINVTGNRTKQIGVDSKYYTIDNGSLTEEQVIVINNMENGQHILDVVRSNQFNKTSSYKTSFSVRDGYNLDLNISSTGTVSLTEKRIENWRGNGNTAISVAAFNKLYAATKKKTSSSARTTFLENEFTNTNKRFTASQASRLIQLVNSESLRFKLAKLSYLRITDRQNFSLVSNLLKSTNNRNELNNYIATISDDDIDDDDNASVPLTDEKFRIIYNEVLSEPGSSDKNYYLQNFFSKDFNYYTSSQAKQFIQLITTETERFELAKIAYRGITDRENYGEVYQLLSNSSNRTALLAYIRSYDNENARQAMSVTDFNTLYQSVYNQTNNSSRYYAINNALIKTGNYFTVSQTKQLIQLVNEENSRLQLLKNAYKVLTDRANYSQLNDLLSSSASRNEFNSYVANYDNGYDVGGGVAMNEADYNTLYRSIDDAWNSSTRFNLTAAAFNNTKNYFTTYQVRQLLLLTTTESDRLSLAKIAYDNVIDLNNYTQLYELFSSTSSKNDLAKFVSDMQYGGGTVLKTPMTDAEFNSMSRDIQFTFGIGAKMSALAAIFNKETNYFTVQQAKQLIQMVSAEYNRLELAKSSYNNITDPVNFTQIYDIFSTQASKDELAAYVSSNVSLNK